MTDIFNGIQSVPLEHYIIFCFIIFSIGMLGVLIRKNALIILLCIELMLNAINLLLVAFSVHRNDPSGQVFVFFIMALAAAEAAIGLAIIVMIHRNHHTVNIDKLSQLKK